MRPPATSSQPSKRYPFFGSEVIVVYTQHADAFYVKNGVKTSELHVIAAAMGQPREILRPWLKAPDESSSQPPPRVSAAIAR